MDAWKKSSPTKYYINRNGNQYSVFEQANDKGIFTLFTVSKSAKGKSYYSSSRLQATDLRSAVAEATAMIKG